MDNKTSAAPRLHAACTVFTRNRLATLLQILFHLGKLATSTASVRVKQLLHPSFYLIVANWNQHPAQ
jgi:hypothetical protein